MDSTNLGTISPRAPAFPEQPPPAPNRARDRLIIALLIVAAVGSSTSVLGIRQLLVGDVVLVGTLAWVGFSDRYRPTRVLGQTINVFGVAAIGFVVATFIANLGMSFIPIEAALTFAKLAIYTTGACLAADVLPSVSATTLGRYLRRTLQILFVLSIAQQIGHRMGVDAWPLATYAPGPWDRSSFPRSASLFSEPAYLSIFVVIATYRLQLDRQLRRVDLLLSAVLLALAASLAGIALALVAALLGANRRSLIVSGIRMLPLLAFVIIAIAVIPTTRDIAQRRVIDRIEQTASGTDASGSARLVDSWSAAFEVVDGRLLTGVGVGQLGPELAELFDSDTDLGIDPRLDEAGGTWNVLANVVAETGLIGLLTLGLALRAFGLRTSSAVLLFLVCFATGTFAGWLWWSALALLVVPTGPCAEGVLPLPSRLSTP